jgi:hypothetical protein
MVPQPKIEHLFCKKLGNHKIRNVKNDLAATTYVNFYLIMNITYFNNTSLKVKQYFGLDSRDSDWVIWSIEPPALSNSGKLQILIILSDDYDDDDDTTEDTGRSSPPALPPKRIGVGNRGRFYQPYSSDSVSARWHFWR